MDGLLMMSSTDSAFVCDRLMAYKTGSGNVTEEEHSAGGVDVGLSSCFVAAKVWLKGLNLSQP
jgi:hypothetical protein